MTPEVCVYPFPQNDPNELFPEALRRDDWVAFHGTTGSLAEKIETEGFLWSGSQIAKSVIAQVVTIGERLVWRGPIRGGLSTLSPFTLGFDFGEKDRKPIYFGETPSRSLRYAMRDTAGGETMEALRKTFAYFERLLNEPLMRSERLRYLERCLRDQLGNPTPEQLLTLRVQQPELYQQYAVEELDLDWLHNQWDSLSEVRQRCQAAFDAHTHGVIYAVRFTEEDLPYLSWHPSMGILADGLVPLSRIVGKVIVPADASDVSLTEDLNAVWRLDNLGGLYMRLHVARGR
jgi:hypothetical protein